MNELLERIINEIRDNISIPGYGDKVVKDIASLVLTIAFSIVWDNCADMVSKKKLILT